MIVRKLIISSVLAVAMITSAFSQTSYPKKLINGKDTIIAITVEQMKVINRSLNDYEHLQEVNKVLEQDLALQDSARSVMSLENQALERIISSQDKKMDLTKRSYDEQLAYKEALLRQYKKKSRKQTIGVGVGGTLLGFILGVLLIR